MGRKKKLSSRSFSLFHFLVTFAYFFTYFCLHSICRVKIALNFIQNVTFCMKNQKHHKGDNFWNIFDDYWLLFLPSHEVWMIWHDSIKRHKRWSMLCHESNLGSRKFRIFCCTPFVMNTWILSIIIQKP